MAVCRYWQQGSCRFGDNCRFDHPPRGGAPPSNGNRFAPLQNNAPSRNNNSFNQQGPPTATIPYSLDKAAILADLTTEAPQWILSAYGPGRAAPAQLFGGAREQSPEEMRLIHYVAMAAGNPQQAVQEADKLFQSAQQQMQAAANNVDAAIEFIINGEREHPNRVDIVNQTAAVVSGGVSNPFAQNASPFPPVPAANPFGAPSQQATRPLGVPSASAFGQPSGLGNRPSAFAGQAPTPAFGGPTQIGTPSPFGQPSTSGSGAFGQPSTLGATAPFGQTSALGGASPFGQPSALGQKPNPFGTPSNATAAPFSAFSNNPAPFSQPPAPSTFGNPSVPPQNTFGQASNQLSNPFGTRVEQSTGSFNSTTSQPFGVPSPAPNNPFGAQWQVQAPPNPFGGGILAQSPAPFGTTQAVPPAPNAFGSQSSTSRPTPNPFGSPLQPASVANPFGNLQSTSPTISSQFSQSNAPVTNSGPNPFGSNSIPQIHNGDSTGITLNDRELGTSHPDVNTYCTRDRTGRITSFKGKQVVYEGDRPGFRRPDGKWQRILFPDGPPAPNRDAALSPDHYVGNDALKAEYQYSARHGVFENGKMPLIPPLQEWCSFDF